MKPVLATFTIVGPIIWCDKPQVRMWKILYTNNNDFHHLGRSQMCAGACCYFSSSKPHSGTLWALFDECPSPCSRSAAGVLATCCSQCPPTCRIKLNCIKSVLIWVKLVRIITGRWWAGRRRGAWLGGGTGCCRRGPGGRGASTGRRTGGSSEHTLFRRLMKYLRKFSFFLLPP